MSQSENPPTEETPGEGDEAKEDSPAPPEEEKGEETPPPPEESPPPAAPESNPETGGLDQKPSGEDLSQDDLNNIITATLRILDLSQKKVDEQKIDSHSLTFMLLRIKESLDAYLKDYVPKLNNFLYHSDKITAEYFTKIVCIYPQYCDSIKVVESQTTETVDCETIDCPVNKADLLALMKLVSDNYYAGGMSLKASRRVYKDIYSSLGERIDIVNKISCPLPSWLELQNSVNAQLEGIRDQTFKISAYVNFLKQGESKVAPALDLSLLEKHIHNQCFSDTKKTNQ